MSIKGSVMNKRIKGLTIILTIITASSILSFQAQAAPYQTYVIHTYGGEALLPAVRQQLNTSRDGGTVATYQDKLVLRTTAANYRAVQQLLTQVDGQPQALTVTVRVGNNSRTQSNIQQGRVIISNRGIQGAGIINQSNSNQQSNNLYQVQTLSGSAASISTNTLYSLTQNYQANGYRVNSYPTYHRPTGQIIIGQQILLPTTQGIQVIPRLLANGQVQVQLTQVEEQLVSANSRYSQNHHSQNSAIQGQQLNSTIIVARGQWVAIGQINQNSQTQRSSYGGNSAINNSNSAPIWLLVQ